jgi:hypothetical protein
MVGPGSKILSVVALLALVACGDPDAGAPPDAPPGCGDCDAPNPDAPPPGNGTSTYKVNDAVITYDFAANVPAKGESKVEPTTGATVRRLTSAATDLPTSGNLYNQYSRYSAENVTGEYVLAAGDNSTSSVVIDRATGQVVATLAYDDSGDPAHRIGAYHEIRWHPTMAHPYRVYYVLGTELRMIDDVRSQSTTRSTIKDFGPSIDWGASATAERRFYNDQEGNCSHDGDHFAFMAAYYANGNYRVRAFVHYQVSTDTVDTLYPADLAGLPRVPAGETALETFRYRPNMVEVAPDGSGILLHYPRAYAGNNDEYIGTIFEAPYFWPIDLRGTQFTPFRIGADATHSGWAQVGGAWYLVQQDNRRDKYTAVPIAGAHKGYGAEGELDVNVGLNTAGIIDFFDDGPYYAGVHFGVTGAPLDGWCLVSTYTTDSSTVQYRGGGLFLHQIKPVAQAPVIWHVAPTFNIWPSDNKQDYNEAQAAMNLQGNRIHVAGNWETNLDHVDLFEIELPAAWRAHFGE